MSEERPAGFSPNFQREVQAMVLVYSSKSISRKELRQNLEKLGMALDDEPRQLPDLSNYLIPDWALEMAQDLGVERDVLMYLPMYAYEDQNTFLNVLNEVMAEMARQAPTDSPDEDEDLEEVEE